MGVTVNDRIYDISFKKGEALTAATISFELATKKIKDSGDGLAIFETGDILLVDGSALNDGYYTIATGGVAAEIVVTEALADESVGASVTLIATIYGFMTAVTEGDFRRRTNDFAPVIGVPGAALEYAEDVWRPWAMSDVRGGLGQEEWKDPTRFYEMTEGLRIYEGRVTLDTQFANEATGVRLTKGVDFWGNHYAIDETGSHNLIRKRDSAGNWTTVKTLTHPATDIILYGNRLRVSTAGAYMWYGSGGTDWTQMSKPTGVASLSALLGFRHTYWPFIDYKFWYYKTGSSSDFLPASGMLIGDSEEASWPINGVTVIGGVIAIGRGNGIYIYEGGGNRAEGPVIDFENRGWSGNCKLFTVVDGFLYYNVGNRVKRTDLRGAEFDVTPTITGSAAKERYGFGIPVGGQGRQGHIYVAFDDMEGLYPAVLEMPTIDIGGWRLVYQGASGETMYGAWFSDAHDRLIVNDGTCRTQRFWGHTGAPYADYVQSAYFITSWFDAEDVWSKKIFAALLAYARDLTATERIRFYYEKDYSGSWVLMATLTSGRENQVPFDPTTRAISARKLRLKVVLDRNSEDSSLTPTLILPIVSSYIVRPDPTYAQQVIVRLEDNIKTHDNKPVEQTAATLKAFLRNCESYEFPIEYTDRYGASWDVFIARTEELRGFKYTDQAGNSRQENAMVLTMKEV